MLNKIMASLNGHGTETASLEAALVQLGRDREATRSELADLNKQRHQMLLDDAADADLDKIERLIDRATVRLEKMNLAEAPLQDRIATAQGIAKAKATDRHAELITGKYQKLRAAVLAADQAQADLMAAREAAIGEVGEAAILRAVPIFAFGALLGHGAAATWAAENDRVLEATRAARAGTPAPSPAPAVPARRPARPAQRMIDTAAVRLDAYEPPVPRAPALPDDTAPLTAGVIRARVIRGGYPDIDGRQSQTGRAIRVLAEHAKIATANGAIEIIESPAALRASTGAPE